MKNFIHHEFEKLTRVDSNNGRTYKIGDTELKYPSVTSVVGLTNETTISDWVARVGEEEARKISSRAAKRGTAIHSLCESYLKSEEVKPNILDLEMFNSIKPVLNRIDNIHCLETPLYSKYLEVAGTVDCIAEYEGKLSVIDFKTSTKPKPKEWIHHYFMQTAAYAVMFEELTKVPVPRLLIIMAVDDHEPILFHEKRDDWIWKFKEARDNYKSVKGI